MVVSLSNGRLGGIEAAADRIKTTVSKIEITEIRRQKVSVRLFGDSPLIFNRMAAKLELLIPPGKKSPIQKASTLKHDPVKEFKNTVSTSPSGPTLIVVPTTMLKAAIRCAALDTEGTTKSEIGRLVYVLGEWIHVYGVPKLFMSVVRNSDMNHTPDIRSRAIMADWCCEFNIEFAAPRLTTKSIMALLANAGVTIGIGDYRTEKGRGNYGQFTVADDSTENKNRWATLTKSGGRTAQIAAMNLAAPYDQETGELLASYMQNVKAQGKEALLEKRVMG